MCGICGVITYKTITLDVLNKMNSTLKHRGPDDSGVEVYSMGKGISVGFAHRRLAIQDLSANGHQPMHSSDKRVSVVFNGEIYNVDELKKELNEYPFISTCDTEVIIAAYITWGIGFVKKLNGMFAIALLDRETDTVYLVRDRIGKKPLYYYDDQNGTVVFGSELKPIMEYPDFKKTINKDALGRYLYRTYISEPDTVFCNTYKLKPGTIFAVSASGTKTESYWDVASEYINAKRKQYSDYEEAKYILNELLINSIKMRMISDVPVGAFLSGGIDSSLVCAIAQNIVGEPLKTYSIGFDEEAYNEAVYSKKIAECLGTKHTELYVNENDMLDLIDSIPIYYDEPFADCSQIPSMVVSELAKRDVSVVLTGDGGDELFGGYNIYPILQKVQSIEKGEMEWADDSSIISRILKDNTNDEARTQGGVQTYFNKINDILLENTKSFYYEIESKYNEPRYDVRRMLLDLETSLPADMLAKVDRASMRYALEARCPLLDRAIVDFSFKCPPEFKINNGEKKQILKDVLYDYVPRELIDRPKMGFAAPLDKWIRGALKERVKEFANEDFLRKQGLFEESKTNIFIDEYMQSGDGGKWSGHNFSRIVWSFFMFQIWYEKYMM